MGLHRHDRQVRVESVEVTFYQAQSSSSAQARQVGNVGSIDRGMN